MKELIEKACHALRQADAILIGASNGLSIAEGYNIFTDNEMFRSQFGSFRQRFGIHSVLDGCFHNYPSETDRHEFLSRLVEYWVKDYRPSQVMDNLRAIIGDKPYFILTTNGDTHLELSGFDPACVWEIEGTFTHLLQGKQPDNKQDVVNSFLSRYTGKRLVVLELGIGSRNRIIKQPLMQLVEHEPNATYITLNLPQELYIPEEIAGKSIALPGDIAITLVEINICMEGMHPHAETDSTGKR